MMISPGLNDNELAMKLLPGDPSRYDDDDGQTMVDHDQFNHGHGLTMVDHVFQMQ